MTILTTAWNPTASVCHSLRGAVAALLLAMTIHATAGDGTALLTSSATIDDVHLTSALVGKDSELRFKLRNESGTPLVLLAAGSPLARSSRLLARVSTSEWVEIDSITIPADSTLDLGSSHLRIVLEDVKETLRIDATVPISLRFVRGALNVDAHVTGPK